MALLTFLGAAQQVTGSCYLLESPALGKFLLECGMHQGGDAIERIQEESFTFDPETIDGLILSHAHLDHSGLIPLLVHAGFNGPIYCTHATRKLLKVMLYDSEGLYTRDLEYTNKHRMRRGEKLLKPAYTKKDIKKALSLCEPCSYDSPVALSNDAQLTLHDAGHILGSAIVSITFKDMDKDKTLVFSGDLGKQDSVLMKPPSSIEHADIVLMEGTYGSRNHRGMQETIDQLETVLAETWDKKGNVMIPAFAVGRTQEILFHLGLLHIAGKLDPWQVFLDSPMGIEITSIYQECFELLDPVDQEKIKTPYGASFNALLPNIKYTRTPEESMSINNVASGAIIIAGSGMCTGGRIRHHFKQRIWNSRNTVIFSGFQARGTLGRILVDGARKIKLFRDEFAVKARIETLGGFSAHAGQSELIDWLKSIKGPSRKILIHGEASALETLSQTLWKEHQIKTEIPGKGDQIQF